MAFDPSRDVIVFEGSWDAFGAIALIRSRERAVPDAALGPFGVRYIRGIDKALGHFRNRIKAALRGERLALVIDNDPETDGNRSTLAKVTEYLAEALPADAPLGLEPGGIAFCVPSTGVTIGLWLMPDNNRTGAFEDFLRDLGPARTALHQFAAESTATAGAQHGATFTSTQELKAVVRTYLAWQDPPNGNYGDAIKNGAFNTMAPAADAFVAWFDRMFGK